MSNKIYSKTIQNYIFEVYDDKPDFEVIHVNQVHRNIVTKSSLSNDSIDSDGIYTIDLITPLAIKTADCLPIFVLGKKGVALLHAGWKGVQQKIALANEVKELEPELFFIGPHIQEKNYEVQKEFQDNFPNSKALKRIDDKLYFNLFEEIETQILEAFPSAIMMDSGICTFDDENFNSYRLNKTTKRNWNILRKI